jgi:hypothetical protein
MLVGGRFNGAPATRLSASLGAALWLIAPGFARADAQGTAGLTIGAAGVGVDHAFWDKTQFHLGARGDVLFGRNKNADFGAGPYLELMSHGFDDFQLGTGASLLIPVFDTFPFVASFGGYGRAAKDVSGIEPGIAAELFWGSRSYNFHSGYVMTAGIVPQFRYGLGPTKETSIVIAAQIDFLAIALPFIFLYNAARGGSPETKPPQ